MIKFIFTFLISILILLFNTSCVSKNINYLNFQEFPSSFIATQKITLNSNNNDYEIIASLKKDKKNYYITFLSKYFYKPLASITFIEEVYDINFYDSNIKSYSFEYTEIINSIREIYESNNFRYTEKSSYILDKDKYEYLLSELVIIDSCGIFPKKIIINSKLKYKFSLIILTDTIVCKE